MVKRGRGGAKAAAKRTTSASDLVWTRTADGKWTQVRRDEKARADWAAKTPAEREALAADARGLLGLVDLVDRAMKRDDVATLEKLAKACAADPEGVLAALGRKAS